MFVFNLKLDWMLNNIKPKCNALYIKESPKSRLDLDLDLALGLGPGPGGTGLGFQKV